ILAKRRIDSLYNGGELKLRGKRLFRALEGIRDQSGSWMASVKTQSGSKHGIIIDGINAEGYVMVRDPQGDKGAGKSEYGLKGTLTLLDFFRAWKKTNYAVIYKVPR